jgi:hypothetical protein
VNLSHFFFLLFLFSCASPIKKRGDFRRIYSYTDVTGTYQLERETKVVKNKIVTRSNLIDLKTNKSLEKSITVSQVGTVSGAGGRRAALRPLASEFDVWLEGKKYSSSMVLDAKRKLMKMNLDSPEEKWKGPVEIPFPQSKFFCFYSQVSDCLYYNNFLTRAFKNPDESIEFYLVWDSYPFIQEQLTGVGKNLFSRALLKFDGKIKNRLRYELEVDGQIILYHFSSAHDLVKIAWIAQGITILPPGEEIGNEDE